MRVRRATARDLEAIEHIYDAVHDAEEHGRAVVGWERGVYPVRSTAEASLERGDLFVGEDDGRVMATAIINQTQLPEYYDCAWRHEASDAEVMVMHTLVVDPRAKGKGYGTAFVRFYEQHAARNGCRSLRIDTQEKNVAARSFYANLGFTEADIIPCDFNGIEGISLVCLEKPVNQASEPQPPQTR